MKKSPRTYTQEHLDFLQVLEQPTNLVIQMDRASLLIFAKVLDLAKSSGILPIETCEFCAEIIEFIVEQLRIEVGFDDKFKLMDSEEFWANFFPCPDGVNSEEHKQKILETFKKHRADWRQLWAVD
jgi:hypothetical protein